MAQYKTDLRDIFFNLFDYYKVQDNFKDFTDQDLKEIVREYDKFIEGEVYPTRQIGDEEGVKLTDSGVVTPECFKKANKMFYDNGWYALGHPEEYEGMPVPHSVYLACTSLFNGANVGFSMYTGLTTGAMNVILEIGTKEQKDHYIPKMMSGSWGGTMCLTESGAGSDVGAAKTVATPTGNDGEYNIKGVKIFISSGDNDLYENLIHLVLARTPDAPAGSKGLSLFIVPKIRTNADGTLGETNDVKCTKIEEKMGIHASATCELTFGGNGKTVGQLIGKENEGMANMFILMNEARLLCGVQGESQANLAYELTLQYAKERSQFGKEIIHHPDIKRTLLKMRSISRGMRALNLYTANLFDFAETDKVAESEIALLTPICKSYCSDEGFNVAVDAIQVHGGYGFCTEYGIEQFARDTKIATIYEGTNGIQAIDFVLRKILKDQGTSFMALGDKIIKTYKCDTAKEWVRERELLKESINNAGALVQRYGRLAKNGEIDSILASSTDFLMFCGNLMVAWLLLDSAVKAKEMIKAGATGDELAYLETKIIDYRIFCQHYLVRNTSIAQNILTFEEDLTELSI